MGFFLGVGGICKLNNTINLTRRWSWWSKVSLIKRSCFTVYSIVMATRLKGNDHVMFLTLQKKKTFWVGLVLTHRGIICPNTWAAHGEMDSEEWCIVSIFSSLLLLSVSQVEMCTCNWIFGTSICVKLCMTAHRMCEQTPGHCLSSHLHLPVASQRAGPWQSP